ncbi:hypothetical protein COHA_005401 [Chlorella ohadii]|uniref:Uncharacterized protein n=1 Tax=Chlorella ohadii TaxID=2649997 RepID=A0AAD5DRC8_9CHLO|nr:hypothetical protein COHA_005401 [Chlorella ohadii]
MSKVADVRAAVDTAAGKHQSVAARGRAAVRQAVAALPPAEQPVLQQLLEGLYEAISQEGPDRPFQPPVSAMKAPLWQDACLAYLATCSPAQLSGWRWRVEHDSGVFISSRQAEVELVPFLLHGSRAAIRKVHFDRLRAQEDAYDAEFQHDPLLSDEGYCEGLQDMALDSLWQFQDSMKLRDRLLRPLLEAAVRGGAAALPLAMARGLNDEREADWGGAGAAWAEGWEPEAAAHARFPTSFRSTVRCLLLANHRGLPGTDPKGKRVHLPAGLLLGIVLRMAAPEAEAAWVPLVGPLPSWFDLNSDM